MTKVLPKNPPILSNDLSEFGTDARYALLKLIASYIEQQCSFSITSFWLNQEKGYVFLTNEEDETYMLNSASGRLEQWHYSSLDGHEGFLTDLASHAKKFPHQWLPKTRAWLEELRKESLQ
jgi:hypothetical protein